MSRPANRHALKLRRIGNGPRRILCVHGFPDNAETFAPLEEGLLNEGATVITPKLRGYGENGGARFTHFRAVDLGQDILRILDELNWRDAWVIGHDWGAFAGYSACALAPQRIQGLVAMAVPPPLHYLRGLRHGAQRRRSSYMAFFQLGRLAEAAFARKDFAAIDSLWQRWSPGLSPLPEEHLESVKATFQSGSTVRSALNYYRQLLPWGPLGWVPWIQSYQLIAKPLVVPTRILHGATDGCIGPELFQGISESHAPIVDVKMHPTAGHFLHWEDPEWVLEHILDFMTG